MQDRQTKRRHGGAKKGKMHSYTGNDTCDNNDIIETIDTEDVTPQYISMGENASIDEVGPHQKLRQEIGYLNNKDMVNNCRVSGTRRLNNMGKDKKDRKDRASECNSRSMSSRSMTKIASGSSSSSFYGTDMETDTNSTSSSSAKTSRSTVQSNSIAGCRQVVKTKGKIRSGMYDKHNEEVKKKLKWPHRNLDYTYKAKNVEYKDITYNQYVAGESKIIGCVTNWTN